MKQFFCLLLSFILIPSLWTQNIDETRMKRDLEVAENILSTLMSQKMNRRHNLFREEIESSYLENYGVVFRIPHHSFRFLFSFGSGDGLIIEPPEPPEPLIPGDDVIIDRKINKDVKVKVVGKTGDPDDDGSDYDVLLKQSAREFLTDYGHLIGQLKSTDKISVRAERSGSPTHWAVNLKGTGNVLNITGFSLEIGKSDIDEYQKGNINRDQLNERIAMTENEFDPNEEPEIEMFSTILKRMYETDLSDTYYMTSQPYYERMKNFGVTYYLKYYSSIIKDDLYTLPTLNKSKIDKKERDVLVESLYPKFLEGFKKNILDYGHILKGLSADEIIHFQIKLTECKGCNMPQDIEVTLPASVARDFNSGKIDLKRAVARITVKDVK